MSAHLPSLLLVGTDDSVRTSQAAFLRRRKYSVKEAAPDESIMDSQSEFEIVILNHTIPRATRQRIADSIKRSASEKLVLILHASGARGAKNVDAAVDSRKGPDTVLKALNHLTLMKAVREHNHADLADKCVVVVDKDRHYTFVSDGACELLGYSRAELIGRQIEEISLERQPEEVEAQFRQFVNEGTMEGEFTLRHRSGKPVRIRYSARVQPDGCLMAVWRRH